MVEVALRESLLAPHNLALEGMGESKLGPKDIQALAALDPLSCWSVQLGEYRFE